MTAQSARGRIIGQLQPPPGATTSPRWTGPGFSVDGRTTEVLSYAPAQSGWSDQLTLLHEDRAAGRHFIDIASRRHTISQLRAHLAAPGAVILEVGSSSGYMLADMRAAFPDAGLIGSDYTGENLARLVPAFPDIPLIQFDLTSCPFPDDGLDAVVALNVLEHIDDDCAAMRQIRRILKPGGIAVLEVPAGPELYDSYDRALMHFRRYRMAELKSKLQAAGLGIATASHLGCLLFPAFWLAKKRPKPQGQDEQYVAGAIESTGSGLSHAIGRAVMTLEAALRAAIPLPVGIRCVVTCIKPR